MISSTRGTSLVSAKLDSKGTPPSAALLQRPSFSRADAPADAPVDGSSVSRIYDLRNPTHVSMKERNEKLALFSAAHMRTLKDATGIQGSCLFSFGMPGGGRGSLNGTSNSHTVRFDNSPNCSITIKNGEITNVRGKISPLTLNSNLSFLVAALTAPGAENNLRKNG